MEDMAERCCGGFGRPGGFEFEGPHVLGVRVEVEADSVEPTFPFRQRKVVADKESERMCPSDEVEQGVQVCSAEVLAGGTIHDGGHYGLVEFGAVNAIQQGHLDVVVMPMAIVGVFCDCQLPGLGPGDALLLRTRTRRGAPTDTPELAILDSVLGRPVLGTAAVA